MYRVFCCLLVLFFCVPQISLAESSPAPPKVRSTSKKGTTLRMRPPMQRRTPPVSKKETFPEMYQRLVRISRSSKRADQKLFLRLARVGQTLNWKNSQKQSFAGNLRIVRASSKSAGLQKQPLYILRKGDGSLFFIAWPSTATKRPDAYVGLEKAVKHKMQYTLNVVRKTIAGSSYAFVQLTQKPKRAVLDRLFFICIVLMLFLVMVGMGLTLTVQDFAMILKSPKGMIVGPVCQFGLLPLLAFGIGHLFGFASQFPFIFLGLLLVSCSPGGVTSNLMTYFARGDVALSVSLTAFSTVLSVFFTPLLLGLYGSNVPNLNVPVSAIGVQILVLVIVPLCIGMLVRSRAPVAAQKSERFFSFLGVFALIFLIVVGILSNLDKFTDTERYGVAFYSAIFCLTFSGMFLGAAISKMLGVSNFQTRAIALETGLQNASLAMTFALLLQDQMGDFYSSMFFTSGIFGLWMYFAGGVMLLLLRAWLPLPLTEQEAAVQS